MQHGSDRSIFYLIAFGKICLESSTSNGFGRRRKFFERKFCCCICGRNCGKISPPKHKSSRFHVISFPWIKSPTLENCRKPRFLRELCVDPFSGLPREKKRKRRNFYSSLKFVEENSVSYLPTILIHLSFDFYSQRLVLKIRKEEKRISYRSSSNTSRNDAVWISFKWTRYRFSQISQLY